MRTPNRDIKVKESDSDPNMLFVVNHGSAVRVDRDEIPELIEKLERELPEREVRATSD
jgi:hypothetical protein